MPLLGLLPGTPATADEAAALIPPPMTTVPGFPPARNTRLLGIGIAGWLLLLHGFVLVPLVMIGYRGFGSKWLWEFLLNVLVWMTRWIDAPAIVLATVYGCWRAFFAERLLTLRLACGLVIVSAAFGLAWLTMLRAAGVQFAALPATDTLWMLSPALLPVTVCALAPWSLSHARHT